MIAEINYYQNQIYRMKQHPYYQNKMWLIYWQLMMICSQMKLFKWSMNINNTLWICKTGSMRLFKMNGFLKIDVLGFANIYLEK